MVGFVASFRSQGKQIHAYLDAYFNSSPWTKKASQDMQSTIQNLLLYNFLIHIEKIQLILSQGVTHLGATATVCKLSVWWNANLSS